MKKVVFGIVALAVALVAQADKVQLKSGSYLTGQAGEIREGVLTFVSDDLGEMKIKTEAIEKLVRAEATLDAAGMEAADLGPAPKPPETWHGSVHVGFNAARGNTYENAGSVVANASRRWEKDRLTLNFGYYYSETGKAGDERQKTTDRWEGEAKHDHFWAEKIYHYVDLRYDRDMIQNLEARYRLGLGGGYQWLENAVFEPTGTWSFNQEIGANWVKEEYEGDNDAAADGFAALRYAHHLNYVPKWVETVNVFHNFEYMPDVDDWDKVLAKADLGLTTKIVMDFDLLVKMEWDYNSKPAGDRKKDDLRYLVGIGYKW